MSTPVSQTSPSPITPDRRGFILAASAMGLAAAAGSNYLLAVRNYPRIVGTILDFRLGPFLMSAEDRDQAIAYAVNTVRSDGASDASVWALGAMQPFTLEARMLPGEIGRRIAAYERQIITAFLSTTDYLSKRDLTTEAVAFIGPQYCRPLGFPGSSGPESPSQED